MKLIPLNTKHKTKNAGKYFAQVGDEDYDYLMQWNWYAHKLGNTHYAIRGIRKNKKHCLILMHRVLLNPKYKERVDHKDHDGLNNQRSNLRIATPSQNAANRKPNKNGYSKYLGVCFDKQTKKWRVFIRKNYKKINLGRFSNEIEAALAYDAAAVKYHGEFANLNFK